MRSNQARTPLLALLASIACATAPIAPQATIPTTPETLALSVEGQYSRGAAHPKVIIVEFADFQCPFCKRAEVTLLALLQKYPDDVAVVWRNQPLAFHRNAAGAAEAALAAGAQGEFWQMHDVLFEHLTDLSSEGYPVWAAHLGLDVARFKSDLEAHRFQPRVEADIQDAKRVDANGTPTFFVNGRRLSGAQPLEKFEALVKAELDRSTLLLQQGLRQGSLYPTELALNRDEIREKPKPAGEAGAAPGEQAVRVAIGGGYARGPADAKVTIVEFADFQCPFCGRAEPTLAQLLARHPGELRVVWRDDPLPFHQNAPAAGQAAFAAGAQGKFWEMHDKLFERQRELGPDAYDRWAQDLGLDMTAFRSDMETHRFRARQQADAAYAASIGVSGTPTFFIDGRKLVGAQPFDKFEEIVAEELRKADALIAREAVAKRGGGHRWRPDQLYDALVEANVRGNPGTVAPAHEADRPSEARVTVDLGDAPVLGPASAPVTIVEFADFQCPYSGRAEGTLKQIREHYGDRVRFVWKNQPLPFHPNASPAALAALAAHRQGRFWAMHDLMFGNQQRLGDDAYRQWAGELGLDVGRFDLDRASADAASTVRGDAEQGKLLGANGTPTFFINGRRLVGAQPLESFERLIDEELHGVAQIAK